MRLTLYAELQFIQEKIKPSHQTAYFNSRINPHREHWAIHGNSNSL